VRAPAARSAAAQRTRGGSRWSRGGRGDAPARSSVSVRTRRNLRFHALRCARALAHGAAPAARSAFAPRGAAPAPRRAMTALEPARGPAWWRPRSTLQALLLFVVVAPLAEAFHWGALAVFACSALAIVPLAGLMGEATERLASRLGAGVGGLLNATFGNAA